MSQNNFWESFTKSAADLGKTVTDSALQATQAVTDTAAKVGETVGNATVQAGANLAKVVVDAGSAANKAIRHLVCFSENDSLAFYGVLFAVAAADGSIDAEELSLILSSPDISNMSKSARQQIQSYAVSPPDLEESIKKLSKADEKLRFGLMFYIFNIVWVDKVLDPGEQKAIELAQKELGIATEQVKAIDAFVQKMGEIRDRGFNDKSAMNSVKEATERLKKVGVPIESFSTSEEGNNPYNISMTYSDELFWEKLAGFASQAGRTLVEKALNLYYVAEEPNLPPKAKLLILGALAYFISPIDAVPDIIPAVGFGDDLGTLTITLASIAMNVNDRVKEKTKQQMREWFGDSL